MDLCLKSWLASRLEADTMPVTHVCLLPKGHKESCICNCGVRVKAKTVTFKAHRGRETHPPTGGF